MSAGKMPASGNPPTPTPELLRCNVKVIRPVMIVRKCVGYQQTITFSESAGAGDGLFRAMDSSGRWTPPGDGLLQAMDSSRRWTLFKVGGAHGGELFDADGLYAEVVQIAPRTQCPKTKERPVEFQRHRVAYGRGSKRPGSSLQEQPGRRALDA